MKSSNRLIHLAVALLVATILLIGCAGAQTPVSPPSADAPTAASESASDMEADTATDTAADEPTAEAMDDEPTEEAMDDALAEEAAADTVVHLTFIHLNDVYEIIPVSGGALGGLARVATLKKQLQAENPNTYLTLAGDYHGPSGMGLAVVDDEQLAGEQVVAVLNKVGVDYSAFGDHEFNVYDIEQHLARIAETEFPVLSSNIFDGDGNSFAPATPNAIFTASNADGASVEVAIFGITEPLDAEFEQVTYLDSAEMAAEQVAELSGQVDILIALTHQKVSLDSELAQQHPEIDLILGGDEHEHMKVESGEGLAPIYKSDSNDRNVQIVDLYYDTASGELRIEDRLQAITDALADDPDVAAVVEEWVNMAYSGFRAEGIEPTEVIAEYPEDLDGFATSVRNFPTALTQMVANGINDVALEPDLSMMTGGLIRLDDLIPAGSPFLMYDVLRTYPSNFQVVSADVTGAGLQEILTRGQETAGSSFYLVPTENVTQDADGNWLVDGEPIDPERTYRVGASEPELFFYRDLGLEVVEVHEADLRQVLIDQLRKGS